MANRINQAVTLEDGRKYAVAKQAIYKNENYYAAARLTEDGENLTDEFLILHEYEKEDGTYLEPVEDPALLKLVASYLGYIEK